MWGALLFVGLGLVEAENVFKWSQSDEDYIFAAKDLNNGVVGDDAPITSAWTYDFDGESTIWYESLPHATKVGFVNDLYEVFNYNSDAEPSSRTLHVDEPTRTKIKSSGVKVTSMALFTQGGKTVEQLNEGLDGNGEESLIDKIKIENSMTMHERRLPGWYHIDREQNKKKIFQIPLKESSARRRWVAVVRIPDLGEATCETSQKLSVGVKPTIYLWKENGQNLIDGEQATREIPKCIFKSLGKTGALLRRRFSNSRFIKNPLLLDGVRLEPRPEYADQNFLNGGNRIQVVMMLEQMDKKYTRGFKLTKLTKTAEAATGTDFDEIKKKVDEEGKKRTPQSTPFVPGPYTRPGDDREWDFTKKSLKDGEIKTKPKSD